MAHSPIPRGSWPLDSRTLSAWRIRLGRRNLSSTDSVSPRRGPSTNVRCASQAPVRSQPPERDAVICILRVADVGPTCLPGLAVQAVTGGSSHGLARDPTISPVGPPPPAHRVRAGSPPPRADGRAPGTAPALAPGERGPPPATPPRGPRCRACTGPLQPAALELDDARVAQAHALEVACRSARPITPGWFVPMR